MWYDDGTRVSIITLAGTTVPNNTGLLRWPTDSTEMTLRFGQIDEQYNAVHTGIDVQGVAGTPIYSAANGTVAHVQTNHSYYGSVIYINSRYNGNNIQIRYAHLRANSIKVSVGQQVNAGHLIAEMGNTGQTSGGSLLEIELLRSTNGQVCATNGSNTTKVDPMPYFPVVETAPGHLSKAFATSLNTNGVNTASYSDQRYISNQDLGYGEVYLRRTVEEFIYERSHIIGDFNQILQYNWPENTATVRIYGKSKTFGPSLGNAKIVNNRMVIDFAPYVDSFHQRDDYKHLNFYTQLMLGGKYRDGSGGMSRNWHNGTAEQKVSIQDQSTSLRGGSGSIAGFDIRNISRVVLLNNSGGAFGNGHNAVMLITSPAHGNVALYVGFYTQGQGLTRVRVMQHAEWNNFLYGQSYETGRGYVGNVCASDGTMRGGDYNRFTVENVTVSSKGNAAFDIAVERFINPSGYNIFAFGDTEQCDVVANVIINSAATGYTREALMIPNISLGRYCHNKRDAYYIHESRWYYPVPDATAGYVWNRR